MEAMMPMDKHTSAQITMTKQANAGSQKSTLFQHALLSSQDKMIDSDETELQLDPEDDKKDTDDDGASIGMLLSGLHVDTLSDLLHVLGINGQPGVEIDGKDFMAMFTKPQQQWLHKIIQTSLDSKAFTQALQDKPIISMDELQGLVEQLMQSMNTAKTNMVSENQSSSVDLTNQQTKSQLNTVNAQPVQSENQMLAVVQQGREIMERVTELYQSMTNSSDMKQNAQEILQLLQKWTTLDGQSNGTLLKTISDMDDIDPNVGKSWQSMVQLFEKRTAIASRQQYSFNAKVSASDIAKWLGNMLKEGKTESDPVTGMHQASATSMPMSKVEQHVIHVQQQQEGKTMQQQQLLDELQKIIKASDLQQLQRGKTQMNISLRPQHLGDLVIKMQQINGEMMVKIVVHSNAAKEMLESNLHQLKSMFSPHQVAIEREDMQVQSGQAAYKDQDDQSFNEQQQHFRETQQFESEQNENEEKIEETFADMLMHAKV